MDNFIYINDSSGISSYELQAIFNMLRKESLFHEKIGTTIRILGYNGNNEDIFDISFTIGGKNSKRLHIWQSSLEVGLTKELSIYDQKKLETTGYLIQIYRKWKKS